MGRAVLGYYLVVYLWELYVLATLSTGPGAGF